MAARSPEKVPTFRPASPLFLLVSAWPLVVLTPLLFALTGRLDLAAFVSAALFLAYRVGVVRLVLLRAHADSLKAIRQGRFDDAVLLCWEQERFFERHPWLDRHRAWVLLSAARYPLRALARHNRAYALYRAGREAEARSLLDQIANSKEPLPPSEALRQQLNQTAGRRLSGGA